MFKSPFSFEGRIRRLEYGLSYIIFLVLYFFMAVVWEILQEYGIFFYFYFVILTWLFLAQGAKRCHDLGNSGFFQFIPFYGLWMLFQDGQSGSNKYGDNPKTIGAHNTDNPDESIVLPHPNYLELFTETSSLLFLNVFLMAIIYEFVSFNNYWVFGLLSLTVIPCYFTMLALNLRGERIVKSRSILFKQRVLYSSLVYLIFRTYLIVFKGSDIYIQTLYYEVFLILILSGISYIPLALYRMSINKRLTGSHEA